MLSIALLGTPTLTLDASPLPITRRKSRAILYYLASHTQPLTRDHLLALFWPDLERPAAQQTLRTTLHGLRKSLGKNLLVEEDTLGLTSEVDVDVRRFEAGLFAARQQPNILSLIATLLLYRGDFLDGFSLPDSPEFDDWAAAERERLRRMAVRGYTGLSRLYEAEGNYPAALENLERAIAFDALQEDLQRAAMRLHYLAGDRAAAIRRYDALRKLLDKEMGVPPMAETRQLYDQIINDKLKNDKLQIEATAVAPTKPPREATTVQSQTASYQLPFTGRQAELETLRGLAASHKLGLIEGEPGIGKTRLSEEFIQSANAIALKGSAHELEDALPYHPIIEALRSLLDRTDWPALHTLLQAKLPRVWLAEVARLLPELDEAAQAAALAVETASQGAAVRADESRLWEGLHQFLIALAAEHPVVLFVDDLQWADPSTLAMLGYLVRQPPAPVTYLATARMVTPRSPLAALLQTLTREDRLVRLPLHRLTNGDVIAIAQGLCSNSAEALAEWLVKTSEGNPYVLAELLRFAREGGLLLPDGTVNTELVSKTPIVPHTIYTLAQSRLARLSDPARRVLDTAVAIGRDFEFEVVSRAAGLSEAAALDAIDELVATGLIRPLEWTGTARRIEYTFDHSVTMEVAYREVGEARHRLAHRRVAEAIESVYGRTRLDAVAGLIASHYMEGNDPDKAAPYAIQAGKQAVHLAAWKEAAAFFEMALAADLSKAQKLEAYMELGEAYTRNGEAARATEAYGAAVELAEPGTPEAQIARLGLARSYIMQTRFADVIEQAKQVEPITPSFAAQAEYAWGTALSLEGADLEGAAVHLRKGEAFLKGWTEPDDLPWLAQIKFELAGVAAQQGDIKGAVELYREALDIAEESPDDLSIIQRILANNNLGYHLHLLGDPMAEHYAQAGLQLAQEKGVLPLQAFMHSTLGEIALAAGKIDEAEKHFNEGLALAERLDMPERMTGLTANLGLVAKARSQTDLAIHRLSSALTRADSLGLHHLAAQIRLWLAPLLPTAEAHDMLAEARAMAESSGRKRLLAEIMQMEKALR